MAQYFKLILDTTAPAGVSFIIDGGNTYTSKDLVPLTITTSDESTAGYQMKIWGAVDPTYDTNIKTTETESSWISYAQDKNIKLSSEDGQKVIYLKLRDDVYNASDAVSQSIIKNTSIPVVEITGIDRGKISKNEGANVMSFSFTVTQQGDGLTTFKAYKVMVVSDASSTHSVGTVIGTTNGSTNMSAEDGTFALGTPINCTINGADLEAASSGDGEKFIKVFVQDMDGNWSV